MFNEIKEKLLADTSLIIDILEHLDCHDVKEFRDEIRCALPDSKNNTSVRIKKTWSLPVDIFSRHDFDDFEIADIFALVQFIRDCNLSDSMKLVCSIAEIEIENSDIKYKKSKATKEIRRFKPKKKKELTHEILDESFLEVYDEYTVKDWIEEGIDEETQRLFGVRRSTKYKRWIIPIRDEFGRLISTKGRTYESNHDLRGIYKYMYYPKFGFNDILFGYNLTAKHIYDKDEVVIVEAEKSVMKAWAMNEKNFVAAGRAGLNEYQIKKIIQMPCRRVTIAYDKDIGMNIVQKDIDSLKYYKEVYYILDKGDLLDKKDSPVDNGFWTWLTLYEKKVRGK